MLGVVCGAWIEHEILTTYIFDNALVIFKTKMVYELACRWRCSAVKRSIEFLSKCAMVLQFSATQQAPFQLQNVAGAVRFPLMGIFLFSPIKMSSCKIFLMEFLGSGSVFFFFFRNKISKLKRFANFENISQITTRSIVFCTENSTFMLNKINIPLGMTSIFDA